MRGAFTAWVLYESPADFPGEWVVRRQTANGEAIFPDPELSARGTTREECVNALMATHPEVRALAWVPRHHTDDPVIAGSWI